MIRTFSPMLALLLVTACGPGNPLFNEADVDPSLVDPTNPNTSISNRFLFDLNRNLTMNAVEYDAENDELVINNIPFDGPDGRYDRVGTLSNGGGYYASRETPTTGQIQSYAVFLRSDMLEATAANGAEWSGFGYGGANINREDFNLPDSGEYVYVGVYSGVRTFDDRGGLELVAGDVEVLLDIDDLDPSGDIQGSIVGTVYNRQVTPLAGGGSNYGLPAIQLTRVSFDTAQGYFVDGESRTFNRDGDQIGSGTYEGLIAGDDGEEIGGYVVLEGVAREVTIEYEVLTYSYTERVEIDVGGIPVFQDLTRTETANALSGVTNEQLQDMVDGRNNIPRFEVDRSDLPEGYEVEESVIETRDLRTSYNARELGVFLTEQLTP